MFEDYHDEVEESINEGRVHVDDVVALLECHAIGDFDIGAIIGVGAPTVVGYICNFKGKCIVCIGVCLAAGIVSVEGGIDGNIQEIHLFGDGGLVCLDTFAQVLKDIVEEEEDGGTQTRFRWCWEGKAHTNSQDFCIRRGEHHLLFTYYLYTMRTLTKLVAQIRFTFLLGICLLRYSGASGLT